MTAPAMEQTYFEALGNGRYMPTEHASGAWRDDELHLAPVAGLIIHHLERWRAEHADPSMVFSRITLEVLGQIARSEIELTTEVVRPGRTIELVQTTAVVGGRTTILARAWLLQTSDTGNVEGNEFDAMPSPDDCEEYTTLSSWPGGFIRSLRGVCPSDNRPGRARVWITSDLDLVAGEPSIELAEFAKFLDTSNGIGPREDPTKWFFPNVDLSLHFFRQPQGRQVGFDGKVAFGANGIGLTSTVMHDLQGPVGVIQQSLTVRPGSA